MLVKVFINSLEIEYKRVNSNPKKKYHEQDNSLLPDN